MKRIIKNILLEFHKDDLPSLFERTVEVPFCDGLDENEKSLCKCQRIMERSRRLTNPNNYNKDGTVIKNIIKWNESNRYKKLKAKYKEEKRRSKATRKKLHGEYANKILSMGNIIKIENVSYKSFQKNYGKSVGFRGPGIFLNILKRKAESAGGYVKEFSTYKTKLSQTCICSKQHKKDLSERWHRCSCGIFAQRDLFSAFLSQFVENDILDTSLAEKAWATAESLLERAVSRCKEQAKGKHLLSCFGFRRQSLSHVKEKSLLSEAIDVVGQKPRAIENLIVCS